MQLKGFMAYRSMGKTMIATVLMIVALVFSAETQAADQRAAGKTSISPTVSLGVIAAGAAEDNLKACLARIPKDASAGQHLMAVQSCERDDEGRQTFFSPGR